VEHQPGSEEPNALHHTSRDARISDPEAGEREHGRARTHERGCPQSRFVAAVFPFEPYKRAEPKTQQHPGDQAHLIRVAGSEQKHVYGASR
jgi:hypothetical protein